MNKPLFHVKVSGVRKKFTLQRGSRVILNLIFSSVKSKLKAKTNILEAVRGIDLEAKSGEIIGIIGRNGSGKSTFLRVLAGLFQADGGTIELHGRVLYLSGLSFSTDPYMTVRDNIYLICTVLGLRRREIKSKIDGILEFAGLADFLDIEVFKLSSGMTVRLNAAVIFACMEHLHPNVLLMDEVLSVGGDMDFQKKSMAKVESLLATGATIIMVSHDLDLVKKFCDRVLWMESGIVKLQGPPTEVVPEYIKANG